MTEKKQKDSGEKPDVHAQLLAELAAKQSTETEAEGEQGQRGETPSAEPAKASKKGFEEIRDIIEGAQQARVAADAEDYLEEGEAEDDNDTGSSAPVPQTWGYSLEKMNKEWALVLIGSKVAMVREQPHAKEEDRVRVVQVDSFHKLYNNRPTQVMGADLKIKTISWSKCWESERHRRQFDGIEFFPNPDDEKGTKGYLNLWQGFSYQPDPKAGKWAI
ncbi:MAG: hypothetical protein K5905_23045, partial [Roseibium sp.]|nr:hypothetical protein [Roseibium sp.]